MKKLSHTEAELKKSVAYKKERVQVHVGEIGELRISYRSVLFWSDFDSPNRLKGLLSES